MALGVFVGVAVGAEDTGGGVDGDGVRSDVAVGGVDSGTAGGVEGIGVLSFGCVVALRT